MGQVGTGWTGTVGSPYCVGQVGLGQGVLQISSPQNGENINPFGAMAFVAGDQSGPWTGWICPAPV